MSEKNEFYDYGKSSTFTNTGLEIEGFYDDGHTGDNNVFGHVVWDQLAFNDGKYILKNQSFLLINRV